MNQMETDESWAVTEFADADLNDQRRTQRLVEIATVLGQQPSASFPEACGSRAMLKATYRFFDHEAVEPEAILASHVEATVSRLAAVPRVLAVQDTTELTWSHHPGTQGLGPLSGPEHQGLMVHTTLAITPERVPLGVMDQQVWARDPDQVGQRARCRTRPIEQKESQKWLTSLEAVIEASQDCPETHFVSVGDREADVYDLFLVERPANVDLLVRAAWDRRVEHEEKYLWAHVQAQPVAATVEVDVPKRGDPPARRATVEVRFGPVTLRPPQHRRAEHLPLIEVWAVQAVQTHPPLGVEAVEWLLLTTCPLETVEHILERLNWDGGRWGIEVFHTRLGRLLRASGVMRENKGPRRWREEERRNAADGGGVGDDPARDGRISTGVLSRRRV